MWPNVRANSEKRSCRRISVNITEVLKYFWITSLMDGGKLGVLIEKKSYTIKKLPLNFELDRQLLYETKTISNKTSKLPL